MNTSVESLTHKMQRAAVGKMVDMVLSHADKDRQKTVGQLVDVAKQFYGSSFSAEAYEHARQTLTDPDSKWSKLINCVLDQTDPNVARTTALNLGYEAFFRGTKTIRENRVKYQCNIPWLILFDPTSACNMHCVGCWAGEYGNKNNLSFEDMDKIVTEGKELGVYLYMLTGGEPLVRKKDLIALCEKHNDVAFLSFTNATLIDEEFCQDMLRVKNFVPAISVEGFEEATDSRRGEGVFQKVRHAMDILKAKKLPFGVCQVGKAFRNEITPGNFTFRTREFEQMECEFFCKPGTDLEWFAYWKDYCENWLLSLGIKKEHLRLRDHEPAELAFYSRATTDIEYAFPFTDWGELWGIADRTNYDLSRHQEASGKSLEYFDPETNEHYIPYVIEPSLGCDRVALAFLCEAYDEQHLVDAKGKEDVRTVLHLHPYLAPFKCAVLPLSKKLGDKAMEIRNELAKDFMVDYDDAGSIGKRYRRQDEIGTPLCITVDFQTVGDDKVEADGCVTVRDRDTMEQIRMPISELRDYVAKKVAF